MKLIPLTAKISEDDAAKIRTLSEESGDSTSAIARQFIEAGLHGFVVNLGPDVNERIAFEAQRINVTPTKYVEQLLAFALTVEDREAGELNLLRLKVETLETLLENLTTCVLVSTQQVLDTAKLPREKRRNKKEVEQLIQDIGDQLTEE